MEKGIDRRGFLRTTCALGAGIGLAGLDASRLLAAEAEAGAAAAEKLGWRLGCAAYSFNALSFYEAVEKTASLGLHTLEGFTWQRLSKEKPNVQTNPALPAADRKEAKSRLADAGVQIATLAASVKARLDGLKPGDASWPEAAYNGDYIADIALDFLARKSVEADDRSFTASGDRGDLDGIRQFAEIGRAHV